MPRLVKLLDESRFRRVLVDMDGPEPSIDMLHRQHINLTCYKVFRLLTILVLMIYGVACIFYLLADNVKNGEGFIEAHGLETVSEDGTIVTNDI